jgi:hypothetical protein
MGITLNVQSGMHSTQQKQMNTQKSIASSESQMPTPNFSFFDAAEPNFDASDNFIFRTASDFSQFVELTAIREDRTCISIILEYCEEKDLDPEDIAKLVSRPLKEKLAIEMQEEGMLPKGAQLPFD